MFRINRLAVSIPHWVFEKKWWVAYLIINELAVRQYAELVQAPIDEKLTAFVNEQLDNYLEGRAMPPPEVAPVIMNLADDMLAGREPTLRAGDYVTLRNYIR